MLLSLSLFVASSIAVTLTVDSSCAGFNNQVAEAIADTTTLAQAALNQVQLMADQDSDNEDNGGPAVLPQQNIATLFNVLFSPNEGPQNNAPNQGNFFTIQRFYNLNNFNFDVTIYCGEEDVLKAGLLQNPKCTSPDLFAYSFSSMPGSDQANSFPGGSIILCPAAFTSFPNSISGLQMPTVGQSLRDFMPLGGILLHELVHIEGTSRKDIAYLFDDCVGIGQNIFPVPPGGGQPTPGTPDENAQTYAWFATGCLDQTINFDFTTGFAQAIVG